MSFLRKHPLASILAGGALLILLTRLPQFLGGQLVPDGDECIVGVMGKHLLEGVDFPVFFYGQRYGFSLVEAWTAAMFFLAAGVSAVSLKAAMLLLWTLGWLFLVLSVRNFAGMRAAAVSALLLIFCPAWSIWSMKARGGYLTAFALAHLFVWLVSIAVADKRTRPGVLAGMGACLALVFFSQPIWLLGAAPFLVLLYKERKRPADLLPLLAGLAACAIPLLLVQASIPSVAWQTDTFGYRNPLVMLRSMPFNLWIQFAGISPFSDYFEAGTATNIAATFWFLLLVVATCDAFKRLVRREIFSVPQIAMLACLMSIAFCLLINVIQFGYRYLLPLNGFLVIALSIRIDALLDGRWRRAAFATLAAVAVLGAGAMFESGAVPSIVRVQPEQKAGISDARAMRELIERLEHDGIHDVYCFHSTFIWNIIFASQERIDARWTEPGGRRPEYSIAVDLALLSGKRTAVVGEIGILPELKRFLANQGYGRPKIQVVENAFFILPDPPALMVVELGFKPNDPKTVTELLKKKTHTIEEIKEFLRSNGVARN